MVDTRIFTRIGADLSTQVVLDLRRQSSEVTRVAALSTLARQLVDFLERQVPILMRALYSIAGSVMMLTWVDPVLALGCLALTLPAAVLNLRYGKKSLALSRGLHSEMEKEVAIIGRAQAEEVEGHYRRMAAWCVRQSDSAALTTAWMEWFVLAVLAAVLVRSCTVEGATAGAIFAQLRYVMLFVLALDDLPLLVEQTSRLRDITRRVQQPDSRSPAG